MDVVALLARADLPRTRIAIGPAHTVHAVASVEELLRVLDTRATDVVVLDPDSIGTDASANLGICLTHCADVPVVAYVSVSPAGMRHAMALAVLGVRRIVLRGHDDQPSIFRGLLEGVHGDTQAARVVVGLARALEGIPQPLRKAIEATFFRPHAFRTAADLARAAGIPVRTCSRLLARANLATARSFVRAARVVRAHHALRGGASRVVDVAVRLGYGSVEALVRDTQRTTGYRPTRLAERVSPDVLVAQIVTHLSGRDVASPVHGGRVQSAPSHCTLPGQATGAPPVRPRRHGAAVGDRSERTLVATTVRVPQGRRRTF